MKMSEHYTVNENVARTIQYWEHPNGLICEGKFPGWKYYKKGIIIDHNPGASNRLEMKKSFRYIDSKGKETSRSLGPYFDIRYIF